MIQFYFEYIFYVSFYHYINDHKLFLFVNTQNIQFIFLAHEPMGNGQITQLLALEMIKLKLLKERHSSIQKWTQGLKACM